MLYDAWAFVRSKVTWGVKFVGGAFSFGFVKEVPAGICSGGARPSGTIVLNGEDFYVSDQRRRPFGPVPRRVHFLVLGPYKAGETG